jgi:Cysteine sulfinate desulfinase/cysteine desulfurase and related enzymes
MAAYLDHAATTPVSPRAIEAFTRAMAVVGNPSSIHSAGQHAKRLLEEAREQIAATLGCDPIEVVFTSGGTEAINLAIKGLFWSRNVAGLRPRILVPGGEHHATIDTVEWLQQHDGAAVEWLPLDEDGAIRLDALGAVLNDDPDSIALLTLLWANNEVGTVQPIERIAALAAEAGVPLHVDAVSAYGHLPISLRSLPGVSAMSVSAHKIGGPVGVGGLALARGASVTPLIHGGGQQRQVRSGTQDVASAVGFAAAAREAVGSLDAIAAEQARLAVLRDAIIAGVRSAVPDAVLNGPDPDARSGSDAAPRLASNAHFSFPGCEGDSLLFLLDAAGVAVSTGSACQAGIPEPSHVLRAMGRDDVEARGALRITLGRTSTRADVDAFLAALPAAYAQASRAGFADRATTLGSR